MTLLLATILAVLAPAWAGAQMEGGGSLVVEVKPRSGPPRVTPGGRLTLRGSNFDENGRPVEVHAGDAKGPVLATVPVDGRGEFRQALTVPAGTPMGPLLLTATQKHLDDTDADPVHISVDVVADEAQATVAGEAEPQEPEPASGGDRPFWPVPVGLAFAVGLAGGLVVARRRRRASSAAG